MTKFVGAHSMGAQSVYGSLRVGSESITNSKKSAFLGESCSPD